MAVHDPTLHELDVLDGLSVVCVADVDEAVRGLEERRVAELCTVGLQVSGVEPGQPSVLRERNSQRHSWTSGWIVHQHHMSIT